MARPAGPLSTVGPTLVLSIQIALYHPVRFVKLSDCNQFEIKKKLCHFVKIATLFNYTHVCSFVIQWNEKISGNFMGMGET